MRVEEYANYVGDLSTQLLSPEEYQAAKESTLTVFYTPPLMIDSIYKVLQNLGFEKGNILEPSCGVGNFIGRLPKDMNRSKVYGVELDQLSGRIAQELYQKSNVQIKGFEETRFSNNSYYQSFIRVLSRPIAYNF